MSKLQSNKEVIQAASEFLVCYRNCVVKSVNDLKDFGKFRTSFSQYGYVQWSDELEDKEDILIDKLKNILGSKLSNEKSIAKNIESFSQKLANAEFDANIKARELLKFIEKECGKELIYIIPNYLFKFDGDFEEINIGPVRIVRASKFSDEFSQSMPEHRVKFQVGDGFSDYENPTNNKYEITLPEIIILVKINTSYEIIEEEADWLIDVAVSFLRLYIEKPIMMFPYIGKVEPYPAIYEDGKQKYVCLDGSIVKGIGSKITREYIVNDEIRNITETSEFKENINKLFNYKKSSLAERVFNGLGWLTRGRQAKDRDARLLYSFTALEALLTNSDTTAPVVQTIIRHSSVILSNDNSYRRNLSKEIKDLYDKRSKLVHSGSRNVHKSDADKIQLYTEVVFETVLKKCDISISHKTFNLELAQASYGLEWPIKNDEN